MGLIIFPAIPFLVQVFVWAFLVPVVLLLILRTLLKKEPYEFHVRSMNPGVNKAQVVRGSSLDFTHTLNDKEIEIKSDRLYRLRPGKILGLWLWFRGVKERFIIVYQENQTEPIGPGKIKITTRILKEVDESRALGKAMSAEFKVPMDLKKILMIIGFLVICIIIYLVMTGEVIL